MFEEVDDIVALGKLMYLKIPSEATDRCLKCPLLQKSVIGRGWYCDLQSSFGLIHDSEAVFKSDSCPRNKKRSHYG